MRLLLATVLGVLATMAAGASAARAAPVEVDRGPAYFHAGYLYVHLVCPGYSCKGQVGADRSSSASFVLGEFEDEPEGVFMPLPVSRPGRHVTLRLTQRGRTRRLRLPVRRRIDRVRCGYRRFAKVLRTNGSTRLLRVRTGVSQEASAEADIVVCRRGGPLPVYSESWDEYGSDLATATALNDAWAAIAISSSDHYGRSYLSIELQSLHRPFKSRSTYVGDSDNGSLPDPDRLMVAPDGALLFGQRRSEAAYGVCAIDRHGSALLDPGPGVDPRSLVLTGQVAAWRSGGTSRSAALDGPAPDNANSSIGSSGGACDP